ncbi:hypothetical protein, partial [Victivallis lenta]|uniref:hypothetical protein n=1 Tax=Victivallis lenta TaxID=2606640 RepID=UPI003AB15177
EYKAPPFIPYGSNTPTLWVGFKSSEMIFRNAENHFVGTGTLPVGVQGRSALVAKGEIPDTPRALRRGSSFHPEIGD